MKYRHTCGKCVRWGNVGLGKVPDAQLAKKLRVRRETVRLQRAVRGIPAWQHHEPRVLREIILDKLETSRRAPSLTQKVKEEYGAVHERTVYRHLAILLLEGLIVHDEDGYRRRHGKRNESPK